MGRVDLQAFHEIAMAAESGHATLPGISGLLDVSGLGEGITETDVRKDIGGFYCPLFLELDGALEIGDRGIVLLKIIRPSASASFRAFSNTGEHSAVNVAAVAWVLSEADMPNSGAPSATPETTARNAVTPESATLPIPFLIGCCSVVCQS